MPEAPFIGGVLSIIGGLPGKSWKFSGPAFPKQVCYVLKFTSNYEAIEKLILPPPLKVDRSQPPEVIVWYFNSIGSQGPSGQRVDYTGFQFRGYTEHNGVKGMAGWEFVDSPKNDKTAMDIMGSWGVQFGMAKKFADIRVVPSGGNELQITVTRNETTLITMKMEIGAEIVGKDFENITSGSSNPLSIDTLTVREIPNEDWTKFLDRSVLITQSGAGFNITRAWQGGKASIEFGNSPQDPLDELKPGEILAAVIADTKCEKEIFTKQRVLEKLS